MHFTPRYSSTAWTYTTRVIKLFTYCTCKSPDVLPWRQSMCEAYTFNIVTVNTLSMKECLWCSILVSYNPPTHTRVLNSMHRKKNGHTTILVIRSTASTQWWFSPSKQFKSTWTLLGGSVMSIHLMSFHNKLAPCHSTLVLVYDWHLLSVSRVPD